MGERKKLNADRLKLGGTLMWERLYAATCFGRILSGHKAPPTKPNAVNRDCFSMSAFGFRRFGGGFYLRLPLGGAQSGPLVLKRGGGYQQARGFDHR